MDACVPRTEEDRNHIMINILKFAVIIVLAIIGINIAFGVIGTVLGVAMQILFSVAILGGILFVIYTLSGGKRALNGSGNSLR